MPCGVCGFDAEKSEVNRGMRLNGAVCACWAGCAVLAGYVGLAYRVICLRWQQFHSDTRDVGRVYGSGVMGGIDVIYGANSV